MKEETITALACEYAENTSVYEYLQDNPKSTSAKKILDITVRDAAGVLHFLLRRYHLVEKEAVRKEYKDARRDAREGYRAKLGTMIAVSEARKALCESLFPDLAKEVE